MIKNDTARYWSKPVPCRVTGFDQRVHLCWCKLRVYFGIRLVKQFFGFRENVFLFCFTARDGFYRVNFSNLNREKRRSEKLTIKLPEELSAPSVC